MNDPRPITTRFGLALRLIPAAYVVFRLESIASDAEDAADYARTANANATRAIYAATEAKDAAERIDCSP